MGADADFLGRVGPELQLVLPMLDERARRLVLGMTARAAGDGGTGAVAALTGASWQTVADGAAEVASGDSAPPGRVRRPGGGRRPLAEADPGLVPALLALVGDSTRGDPMSPLVWTTKSVKRLAGEMTAAGHPCSPQTCWRELKDAGFTMQSNSRAAEGRQHPDRDAQFRYIAAQAKEHIAAGQPVISVDAKKKEQVGNYGQDGREWRPKGNPEIVRSPRLPGPGGGTPSPTASRTSRPTPGSSTSAPTGTPPPWRWSRSAAGGPWPGRHAYPRRDAAAGHLRRRRLQRATGTGPGRPAWPPWRRRPGWTSPSATSRPAPPSGTRSSTGCSARSPSPGAAAP